MIVKLFPARDSHGLVILVELRYRILALVLEKKLLLFVQQKLYQVSQLSLHGYEVLNVKLTAENRESLLSKFKLFVLFAQRFHVE